MVLKLKIRKDNIGKAQKRKDDRRKMVVRVRGTRLETVRQVKYLGVWIEEGMRGDKHVVEVGAKVTKIMNAFVREMKVERGLVFGTVRKLYQKVIDPGLMYGVEFWGGEVLRREVLRKKWRAVQRKVLIKMVGAYRTVSAEAVCVVAGVEPVDLRIEMLVRVAEDVVGGMGKVESVERRREEMMAK